MAVSRKEKHNIIVDGKMYFWWILDGAYQTEFDTTQIKLIAQNESHTIKYGLKQFDDNRHVVIALPNAGVSIQLECPKFEDDQGIITPDGIQQLVEWCKVKPDETNPRAIKHAYEPKLHPLSEERIKLLYDRILNTLNKR